LQADAIDRLLTSAAELDETPGMVRPITLNVIGYVLASGKNVAPSLNAGVLIRRYIERRVEQLGIRDCAPQLLEQMITEQGTKRPRSEEQLVADTKLRRAEVRAVLNALDEAGLRELWIRNEPSGNCRMILLHMPWGVFWACAEAKCCGKPVPMPRRRCWRSAWSLSAGSTSRSSKNR
jgi:hypothetical protein